MADPQERHIGHRVRAARERLGWSRETLGSRSGVSWAAITQMESGRRTNTRSDTLLALSRALGVTVEYLLGAATTMPRMLDHRGLTYKSLEEMADGVASFVAEGAQSEEEVLVFLSPEKQERVFPGLDDSGARFTMLDPGEEWATPLEMIHGYHARVAGAVEGGAPWVRLVNELPWHQSTASDQRTLLMFESLVDMLYATDPVNLLCLFDAGNGHDRLRVQVNRNHARLMVEGVAVENEAYEEPVRSALELPSNSSPSD